jgi:hypothetical protein
LNTEHLLDGVLAYFYSQVDSLRDLK